MLNMSGKSCEYLDCGYCYDKSWDNNSNKYGACITPKECEVRQKQIEEGGEDV